MAAKATTERDAAHARDAERYRRIRDSYLEVAKNWQCGPPVLTFVNDGGRQQTPRDPAEFDAAIDALKIT